MMIEYKALCLDEMEEIEELCYSIPLRDNRGTLWVELDEEGPKMVLLQPDWAELLDAGFSDQMAAPEVEMSEEDKEKLVTYLKGVM